MTSELTFESTRKIIDTKDYRIQINDVGSGHPVFMLHGGGPGASGWSNFAPNIQYLSGKYRCIAVTMPGWGESSEQTPETGRDGAEALRQLMDALGIERAALVGNSMGGGTSIRFTALYPERVTHLITMGPGGVPGIDIVGQGGQAEGLRVIRETYADPSPQNFKRLVQALVYDQGFATDELAEERSRAALGHPEHLKNNIAISQDPRYARSVQQAEQAALVPSLQLATVPALLIHGRDDKAVHYEASLRLLSIIPNSQMLLLNHCGHWAQLEHADLFNRVVDNFIAHT